MTVKKIIIFVVAMIVISGFLAMTDRVIRAQDDEMDSGVAKSLNDILAGQRAIAGDIAAIRQELQIIKIRITQQQ